MLYEEECDGPEVCKPRGRGLRWRGTFLEMMPLDSRCGSGGLGVGDCLPLHDVVDRDLKSMAVMTTHQTASIEHEPQTGAG